MNKFREQLEVYFEWEEIPDGCWVRLNCWKSKRGYSEKWINGKKWIAHRLAYTLTKGDIPKRLVVRHKCDNPHCINPEHLITGTHADNTNDSIQRGRHVFGERVGTSKLTTADVAFIVKYQHIGRSRLADLFGISIAQIDGICTGRIWYRTAVSLGLGHLLRQPKPSRILSVSSVEYILNNKHMTQKELAKKFGVANSTISAIQSGRSWRDTTHQLGLLHLLNKPRKSSKRCTAEAVPEGGAADELS